MNDQDNFENEKNPTYDQRGQHVDKQYNIGRVQADNVQIGDTYYQTTLQEVT